MKTNIFLRPVYIILLAGIISSSFAQSDYEIVDNYKKQHDKVEEQIKNSTSLIELNEVLTNIKLLRQEFEPHKNLLDKALYPEKFESSIARLNSAYLMRQDDFAKIDILQTEVSELRQRVDFLNKRNNELLAQIEELSYQSKKDRNKIAELENTIADLRTSMRKRDRLVINMVDSLMPPVMREKAMLSAEDKHRIYSEAERENVLQNVKITLNDNIKFLEVTTLKPGDLKEIKNQQQKFSETWKAIGPELTEVYSEEGKRSEDLKRIDSLFSFWEKTATERNTWKSVKAEFDKNGIALKEFTNGNGFKASVLQYINDEIKNAGVKNDDDSKRDYANFTDSTWYAVIEPVWIPYLTENSLLANEDKSDIETKIAEWKDTLYPSRLWIYILASIVVIGIILFFVLRKRKGDKDKNDDYIETIQG